MAEHEKQREVTLGGVMLIATDTVREDGARLYTWKNGLPVLYIKWAEDPKPCEICGLYDEGEGMADFDIMQGHTVHAECFSRWWRAIFDEDSPPELVGGIKKRIGREVRAEKGFG